MVAGVVGDEEADFDGGGVAAHADDLDADDAAGDEGGDAGVVGKRGGGGGMVNGEW